MTYNAFILLKALSKSQNLENATRDHFDYFDGSGSVEVKLEIRSDIRRRKR